MRTGANSLGGFLFGQTRARILGSLFSAPDDAFFLRQIARDVETSVGTVQRELIALAEVGLVLRARTGNQVFYRANRDHPAFPELYALVAKTAGVFHQLVEALSPFATRIQYAFVYGSFARGEEKAESDIDVTIVGAVSLDELLEQLAPLERNLRRAVNPTVYSERELRAKLRRGNHFLKSIQRDKAIFLIGDEGEFRELR